ncbi:MAG: hypothetical protein KDE27_14155 [Planctomycetes bacterium]|nr:hypothetical protein [Planctomycetota bacterium]
MMLRTLVVLSALLSALPAQRGGDQKSSPAPIGKQLDPDVSGETGDAVEQMRSLDGERAALTKEQRALMNVNRGASAFCQFVAHTKPTKLMPGQTGTLIVTAVLKGDAVIPSPAPLEITSPLQQGVLTLGGAQFHQAENGRFAEAYLGRPVYDNYAMFEMPITVASTAEVGQQHTVTVEMKFDLFDGKSAQSIGSFIDRTTTRVEVGQSFDPAVKGGYTPPADLAGGDEAAPVAAGSEPGATPGAATPRPEALGAAKAQAVDEPERMADDRVAVPVTSDSGPVPAPVVDDDSNMWILGAAGGALLAAVLLLIFKRK